VVLSFGAIKGGIRYNIIPDSVELIGTIRTFDDEMRAQVFKDLANVAEHVAAAHGATVVSKIPDTIGNPVTVNDPTLTAKVLPSLRKVAGKDVVEMTLTTPSCPSAQELPNQVDEAVRALDGVSEVLVEVVWDPPWDHSRMSEDARLALNMF